MGNKLCKAGVKDSSSKERKANRETDFSAAEQQGLDELHEIGANGEAAPVVTFEQMVLSDSQKKVVADELDHLGVVQPQRLTTLRAASHEPAEESTHEQAQANGDINMKVAAASTVISSTAARVEDNTAFSTNSDERLQPPAQTTAGDTAGRQAVSTKVTPTVQRIGPSAKQDTSHAATSKQPAMDGIVEDPTASDEEDMSTMKPSSVPRPEPVNDWTEPEAEVKWQPSKRRGAKPPLEQVLSATEADVLRFSATNPFAAASATTSPTNPFADPVLPPTSTAGPDQLRFSANNPFL
eukprot:jgi/Chlat1/3766/Chrsp259S08834